MFKNYQILGVIPARGGSKGLPGKNIRPLLGKPLLYWSIEEAKKSKYIDRLIVSTDDETTAAIARRCGAETPYLQPPEISGDFSTDVEFLSYGVNWFKKNEGKHYDIILRLPPTSPLRRAEHIDKGIELLVSDFTADSVRPVIETPKHPYKMWKIEGEYIVPFLTKEFTGMDEPWNLQRQRFPKVYIHTGALDVMWNKTLIEKKSTSGNKVKYFEMTLEESVNIDSEIDFLVAEVLFKKLQK